MAAVTNWLKQLGKPCTRHLVMIKGVLPVTFTSNFEIWLTDQDNRVLRCTLTMIETTDLALQIRKYLVNARQEA